MDKQDLWVEKYRPTKLSEYVYKDDRTNQMIQKWIRDESIPRILLYGPPGTGKSSLINVLIHELDIRDKLYLNCSEATSIDDVRDKVLNYANNMTFEKFKVIILEEFEQMSISAQAALKRITEDSSDKTRFIFTSNNVNRILPALRSRCTEIYLNKLDEEEFMKRAATILIEENIEVDPDVLDNYFKACYPDLRKMINTLQDNSIDGKLLPPTGEEGNTSEIFVKAIELFKDKKVFEARKYICDNLRPDEYIDFYQFLYRNLDMFGNEESSQHEALLIIANGLKNHTLVADPEINLAATIVKLLQ